VLVTKRKRRKKGEVAGLWRRFVKNRDTATRNTLVEHYLPLVHYHAERIKTSSNLPNVVDINDLISAGIVGLIEAIGKFDPGRQIKFETFCAQRVRGAMFDYLRRCDWVPRQIRSKAHKLAARRNTLASKLERPPSESEMAEELGMNIEEYLSLAESLCIKDQVSIEGYQVDASRYDCVLQMEMAADTRTQHPLTNLQRLELRQAAERGLSEKEKTVLIMYYYDQLTMKEIGSVLGISESRVCQIHSQLLKFLRRKFEDLGLDGSLEAK
jgi:RNA polymerase sigma factor for flagellar operon FliA